MPIIYDGYVSFLVAPRWAREPQDIALMLGQAVVINCEAEGYPKPEITFLKGGNKSNHKQMIDMQIK